MSFRPWELRHTHNEKEWFEPQFLRVDHGSIGGDKEG